jgi:hypothetical protein
VGRREALCLNRTPGVLECSGDHAPNSLGTGGIVRLAFAPSVDSSQEGVIDPHHERRWEHLVVLGAMAISAVTWWCNLGCKVAQPAPRAARGRGGPGSRGGRHPVEGICWSADMDEEDPNAGLDYWRFAQRRQRHHEPKSDGPCPNDSLAF